MSWDKIEMETQSGARVIAQSPLIVSASRATDIPAFYADWFFDRLEKGYCIWTNPFNGAKTPVSFDRTRLIVFWSKNPRPLLPHLHKLRERGIHCYIQYTLNDYEKEGLEPAVAPLEERIGTFEDLSKELSKGLVVWRFDPLILTDRIGVEELLHKIERIGDRLCGYAEKLVFSFADIRTYRKVEGNLRKHGIRHREFGEREILALAAGLTDLNRRWGIELATCAEQADLSAFEIGRNKCIDDELIRRHFGDDTILMNFLGAGRSTGDLFPAEIASAAPKPPKDKGQRPFCGCIASKDIGQYGTCPHACVYCYANKSPEKVSAALRAHENTPFAETLTGR